MTTATDRYKMLLATAFERICVLEEQLEQALSDLAALQQERTSDDTEHVLDANHD